MYYRVFEAVVSFKLERTRSSAARAIGPELASKPWNTYYIAGRTSGSTLLASAYSQLVTRGNLSKPYLLIVNVAFALTFADPGPVLYQMPVLYEGSKNS